MLFVRSIALALALLGAAPVLLVPATASAQDAVARKATTFSTEELDQLLAPIALYPDDLLSNVLVAATYPLEVVQAARWIEEPAHAKLKGDALTRALEDKDWDPSVKALTLFPDVLAMMSEQLDWTQRLGDAFLAREAAVMDRVQFLRDKAEIAGNLKSNDYQKVTTRRSGGSDYIYIEPAEPDVVYVPVYEPDVYGSWWYPDYPPYYWPPADVVFEDDYYWGGGVTIIPTLWAWSSPRWRSHYINVNVHKYNRLNKRRKITSERWRHDAHHRRGVRHHDAKVRVRHVERNLQDAGKRHRGHDEIHQLHKGDRPHASKRSGAHKHHAAGAKKSRKHHRASPHRKRPSAHKHHSRGRSVHKHRSRKHSARHHSRGRSARQHHSRGHAKAHHRGGHRRAGGHHRGGGHKGGHRGRGRKKH